MNSNPSKTSLSLDLLSDDLADYGWNFKRDKGPDGEECLISTLKYSEERPHAVLLFKIQSGFLWVSTLDLMRGVRSSNSTLILKTNDKVPLGKFFSPSQEVPEDNGGELENTVDYGFEIADTSYSKILLFDHLDFMSQNLDLWVRELLKSGVISEKNLSN